ATVVPDDGHPEVVDWWLEQLQRGLQVRAHEPRDLSPLMEEATRLGRKRHAINACFNHREFPQVQLTNPRKLPGRFSHEGRIGGDVVTPLNEVLQSITHRVESMAPVASGEVAGDRVKGVRSGLQASGCLRPPFC